MERRSSGAATDRASTGSTPRRRLADARAPSRRPSSAASGSTRAAARRSRASAAHSTSSGFRTVDTARRCSRDSSRERGLGPWSVGVVCLEGLGRFERGLEGDLGLVKLLAAMRGRRVEGVGDGRAARAVRRVGRASRASTCSPASQGLIPLPEGRREAAA